MARATGIEISETKIRVAHVEFNGKKPRLLSFHEADIPEDAKKPWGTRLGESLKQLLADKYITKDRLVCSIDAGSALIREFTLPFRSKEQIRKTAKFELEHLIHNYTIEELVADYLITGEYEKGAHLLGTAIPKKFMAEYLGGLDQAGLDPAYVDLDIFSVWNACTQLGLLRNLPVASPAEIPEPSVASVAIEKRATKEAPLPKGTAPSSPQTLPFVLIHHQDKFAKLMYIGEGKPRTLRTLRWSASPEMEPPVREHAIELLARELQRFLLSFAAPTPSFLLLSGSVAQTPFPELLERKTGFATRTLNVLEKLEPAEADMSGKTLSLTTPVGLALKAAGRDTLGIDFRQEEFTYRRKFEMIRVPLLIATSLMVILSSSIFVTLLQKEKRANAQYQYILEEQAKQYETTTTKTPKANVSVLEQMRAVFKEKDEKIGGGDYPLEKSSLVLWRDLFDTIQQFRQENEKATLGGEELYLFITTLAIEQSSDKITLRAEATNGEYAERVKNTIGHNPSFKNVAFMGSVEKSAGGHVRFTLEIKLERKTNEQK